MFDLTSTILIVCALIGVVIFIFKRKCKPTKTEKIEVPAFLEKPWPSETEWFNGKKHIPRAVGWYKTKRYSRYLKKWLEHKLYWNGEKWKFGPDDSATCYFQTVYFKGLTEQVTA